MSHFTVLVLTKEDQDPETLLAPYDENGKWFRGGSRWDWWTVGGRWTGLYSDYNPDQDPLNYEVCDLCGGTGTRTDPTPEIRRHRLAGYKIVPMTPARLKHLRKKVAPYPDEKDGPEFHPFMAVAPDGLWPGWAGGCNGCRGTGASRKFHNREAKDRRGRSLDILPAATILEKYPKRTTHAVVTPDGKWHEDARMGWFGQEITEKKSARKGAKPWPEKWLNLVRQHRDCTATLVDCHV